MVKDQCKTSETILYFPSDQPRHGETRNWCFETLWCLYHHGRYVKNINTFVPPESFKSDKIYACVEYDYKYIRGLDWWIYLLTHDSKLQAITASPLISTIHKSPRHPLRPFQPAVSAPAVPWQQFLTVEILQLHSFRLYLHRLTKLSTML
jgi:hypothetical protein